MMGTPLRFHLRSALLAGIAALGCTSAGAQEAAVELPVVDVTSSRLGTTAPRAPGAGAHAASSEARPRPRRRRGAGAGDVTVEFPSGITTGTTITGASTTVITSTDIERNPGVTIQDLLSRQPGIQVRSLFGGVNGAASTVDLRGFGATAANNTLVLINGRRINDLDLAGVDLSTLPRESIDHIEITRGNSGAVLYGDGAVGGVINIVTKTGANMPPSARIAGTFGSFKYAEGAASANGSWGPVVGLGLWQRHQLRRLPPEQRAATAERGRRSPIHRRPEGGVYLNLSADNQHLGFPGGRLVTPTFSLVDSDPRGAATPFDYGDKQGVNVTAGVTRTLAPGTELILDGGIRQKKQQAGFFSCFGFADGDRYVDTTLIDLFGDAAAGQQARPGRYAGKADHGN